MPRIERAQSTCKILLSQDVKDVLMPIDWFSHVLLFRKIALPTARKYARSALWREARIA